MHRKDHKEKKPVPAKEGMMDELVENLLDWLRPDYDTLQTFERYKEYLTPMGIRERAKVQDRLTKERNKRLEEDKKNKNLTNKK